MVGLAVVVAVDVRITIWTLTCTVILRMLRRHVERVGNALR